MIMATSGTTVYPYIPPYNPPKLARCSPFGTISQPIREIHQILRYHYLLLPCISAQGSHQVQGWLQSRKINRPLLDTIEPANLYEKSTPGPLLPGLSRESKMKSSTMSYCAQPGLSLTSGPSAPVTKVYVPSH